MYTNAEKETKFIDIHVLIRYISFTFVSSYNNECWIMATFNQSQLSVISTQPF